VFESNWTGGMVFFVLMMRVGGRFVCLS